MIEFLNNIFVHLYEKLFDYNTYNILLDCVYDNSDYAKIGLSIIIISILFLILFYKVWDPINSPKLKLALTCLIVGLLSFGSTHFILEMNECLKDSMITYAGAGADPSGFILQLDAFSALYGIIISFVLSIFPFRLISTNNRLNPF